MTSFLPLHETRNIVPKKHNSNENRLSISKTIKYDKKNR